MEKIMAGIAALTLGSMGCIFVLIGLINWVVLPEPEKLIGAVFAVIGTAFLIMTLVLSRLVRRYREKSYETVVNGKKIEAKIVEVREITAVRINRRHPYMLICEAEGRTFKSEYFYRDVHRFDNREMIDVYLDENGDEYYVDIES